MVKRYEKIGMLGAVWLKGLGLSWNDDSKFRFYTPSVHFFPGKEAVFPMVSAGRELIFIGSEAKDIFRWLLYAWSKR